MTTARVLLLEAAGSESAALTETATTCGYQVHAATQPDQLARYSPKLRKTLSDCLLTDFSQPKQALDDIVDYARRVGADAVLTTNEYLTPLAAAICSALGLPGNDPALATAARNKADMIRQFTQCSITAPHTRILGHENELLGVSADGQLTFPCIIKPAEGAGSAGVTVVTCAAEVAAAFRVAQEPRGMYGMVLDPRVLVQELIEGTEYSVESITQNGTSTRNGASHTEVILTPDGECTVIEIGARIGAGQIGFLIQHALGIDPWAACLDTALGRPAQLAPTRGDYATVRFLTSSHPGRLATVTGLSDRSPQVPIVRVRTAPRETVNRAEDNTGRLGSFVVVGPDRQSVDRYADHLLAQVRIEVEPIEPTSHSTDH